MPPVDPAALADVVATMRNPPIEFVLNVSDELVPTVNDRAVNAANAVIARHFLALLEAGELVRVRGLEWEWCEMTELWVAISPVGDFKIFHSGSNWWESNYGTKKHRGIERAKEAAFAEYRSRLAAALEPLLPEVRT